MTPWTFIAERRSGTVQAPRREDCSVTGRRSGHGPADFAGEVFGELIPDGFWPFLLVALIVGVIVWAIGQPVHRAEVVR
jgi:hypothetical protein